MRRRSLKATGDVVRSGVANRLTTAFVLCSLAALVVPVAGLADPSLHTQQHSVRGELGTTLGLLARAESSERALAAQIGEQSEQIEQLQGRIEALQTTLDALQRKLSSVRLRLRRTELRIQEQSRRIAFLSRQLSVARARLAERVVAIYTSETPDALAVGAGTASLAELIDQFELRSIVVGHDRRIVAQVEGHGVALARAQRAARSLRRRQARDATALTRRRTQQRAVYASLEAERRKLGSLRDSRERALASIRVQRSSWERQAGALEDASREIAARIRAARAVPPAAPPQPAPRPTPATPPAPTSTTADNASEATTTASGKIAASAPVAAPQPVLSLYSALGPQTESPPAPTLDSEASDSRHEAHRTPEESSPAPATDSGLSEPSREAPQTPSTVPDPPPVSPSLGSSAFIWPVHGPVISPYGPRWGRLHAGIDISAPAGTAIVAAASGTVIYAGWMGGYGILVVVQHNSGLATAYAHNSSLAVSQGQSVAQGETIAAVGCTGSCFGDHVHFEVRSGGSPVDPLGYL